MKPSAVDRMFDLASRHPFIAATAASLPGLAIAFVGDSSQSRPLFYAGVLIGTIGGHIGFCIQFVATYRRNRYYDRRHDGLCPHCGYDLRATPNRCPECGHIIEQ